jgi:hypothetical protein
MPEYQPDLSQRIDIDVLSMFALRMAQAGMPLFPDPETEDFFRDSAGMPLRPEDPGWGLDPADPLDEGDPEATPKPGPGGGGAPVDKRIRKAFTRQGSKLQRLMVQRAQDRQRRRGVAA